MECNKGSWRHFKSRNVNPRWYEQRNGTTECEILNGMGGGKAGRGRSRKSDN